MEGIRQWNLVETILALDINFLGYLLVKAKIALLCTSSGVFGLAYPKILQTVVWDTLLKKRSYRTIAKSLGVLYYSRSPLLSTVRVPLAELNNYLLAAADQGESKNIPVLISLGAQINTPVPSNHKIPVSKPIKEHKRPPASVRNMYALHLACMRGNTEVAEVLVRHGADTRSIIPDKRTALDLAAQGGHSDIVRILVRSLLNTTVPQSSTAAKESYLEGWDEDKIVNMVLHLGKLMDLQTRPSLLHALVYDRLENPVGNSAELLVQLGEQLDVDTQRRVTPLHYAAQCGCCELVKKFIELGCDIEKRAKKSYTPLLLAVYEGKYEAAKALVEMGANIHAKSKTGDTVLCIAGSVELVKFLLVQGAVASEANLIGQVPLQFAAGRGSAEVIHVLVDAGANTEHRIGGPSPINIAASRGHTEAVKALLEKGANPHVAGDDGDTPLHSAACGGHAETVKVLLAAKVRVDYPSNTGATPLSIAAQHGRSEVVDLLVQAGADLNARSKQEVPPLTQALTKSNVDVAKQLIKYGADVALAEKENEERKRVPLLHESWSMDYELMKLLVSRGASVPTDYLYYAVNKNWKEVVRALLELGVNPNEKDEEYEDTPLHHAASKGHTEIAEMLIEKGAHIDAKDSYNNTPLFRAIIRDRDETVEMLLKKGANVNTRTQGGGGVPIEVALCRTSPYLAERLVEHPGIDLDVRVHDDNSVLHVACGARFPSVVRLLLKKGVSTDAKNKYGETPIEHVYKLRDILLEINDPRLTIVDEVISVFAEFNITQPITVDSAESKKDDTVVA